MFKFNRKKKLEYITIVGMKYIDKNWMETLNINDILSLEREKNNKFDKNAIACNKYGFKFGYVSRLDNKNLDCRSVYRIVGISGGGSIYAKIEEG